MKPNAVTTIQITDGCPDASRLRLKWHDASEADKPRTMRALTAHLRGCERCRSEIARDTQRAALPLEVTDEMIEALR